MLWRMASFGKLPLPRLFLASDTSAECFRTNVNMACLGGCTASAAMAAGTASRKAGAMKACNIRKHDFNNSRF